MSRVVNSPEFSTRWHSNGSLSAHVGKRGLKTARDQLRSPVVHISSATCTETIFSAPQLEIFKEISI
jgi:hypothetical protein